MKNTKLIILRGPSGSGKTTVAEKLFVAAKRKTVLIEQDHYRFIFKPAGGQRNSKTIHKMILHNSLAALEDGYDVILEGILNVQPYGEIFETLIREHPDENYFFYFDISFEETLKRHATRQTKDLFTAKDMGGWYKPKDTTGYDCEEIITEANSLEQTRRKIKKITGI